MYGTIKAKPIIASGTRWSSRPSPWVARLTALDGKYGFCRTFMKAIYDYTNAASSGKGMMMYWFVPPGLYEVYKPLSWKHEARYFVCVTDEGEVIEISKSEVIECLKKLGLE